MHRCRETYIVTCEACCVYKDRRGRDQLELSARRDRQLGDGEDAQSGPFILNGFLALYQVQTRSFLESFIQKQRILALVETADVVFTYLDIAGECTGGMLSRRGVRPLGSVLIER